MNCDKCGSKRILVVDSKCADKCSMQFKDADYIGYPQSDVGVGGGDYIGFKLCLQCGKIQGEFPISDPAFSQEDEE
jgi:hypothetical protein